MAGEGAFASTQNVYSYLWPFRTSSRANFNPYVYGYQRRNRRIAAQLRSNHGHVAVINDIRRFYPSISWEDLQPRINRRLEKIASVTKRRAIQSFLSNFNSVTKHGVAVGPDISHVLANIALEDVDAQMTKVWGDAYFRYVDDVIVVCDPSDAKDVHQQLAVAVNSIGLQLHEGKQDVVEGASWAAECPPMRQRPSANSFEEFFNDLKLFLVNSPSEVTDLSRVMVDEGFSLPFGRIISGTASTPFREFARRYLSGRAYAIWWQGSKGLVKRAIQLRDKLVEELQGLQSGGFLTAGMRRRWFSQNIRYRLNRLLYLCDRSTYGRILDMIPSGNEFSEYRLLLVALRDGDPTRLLEFPGSVISTFCEIMSEKHNGISPPLWPPLKSRASAESATLLALYFGWTVSDLSKSSLYQGGRLLLDICSGKNFDSSDIRGQSFLDEVNLLLRTVPAEDRIRYARTRLSDQEILSLEGLGLGGDYLSQ
jgi:hypothetical protein